MTAQSMKYNDRVAGPETPAHAHTHTTVVLYVLRTSSSTAHWGVHRHGADRRPLSSLRSNMREASHLAVMVTARQPAGGAHQSVEALADNAVAHHTLAHDLARDRVLRPQPC